MKLTAIEAAVGIAIAGSVLAVAVPTFVRNLSWSRLAEATDGLNRIGGHAVQGASGKACAQAFPASAPLTPPSVPRGKPAVDPEPDPWQHPTWRALDFRPSPLGVAHSFSFAFENATTADTSSFVAAAHGDLDGDGTTSTFEIRGNCGRDGATVAPGMYVEGELE
jgi:type II secretory pathway pseudopilin PulG